MINFFSLLSYIFLSSLIINLICNLFYGHKEIIDYYLGRLFIFFQNPMIIEIEIGTNFDPEVQIKLCAQGIVEVHWGDGQTNDYKLGIFSSLGKSRDPVKIDHANRSFIDHLYDNPGTYQIKIYSKRASRFIFSGFSPSLTSIKVISWGDLEIVSLRDLFRETKENVYLQVPDHLPKSVKSLTSLLEKSEVTFIKGLDNWNVSEVMIMDRMFYRAKNFRQDISKWKFDNVVSMKEIIEGAESFGEDFL